MKKYREDTTISRRNWKHIFNKQDLWEEIKQDIDASKWDDFHTVVILFFYFCANVSGCQLFLNRNTRAHHMIQMYLFLTVPLENIRRSWGALTNIWLWLLLHFLPAFAGKTWGLFLFIQNLESGSKKENTKSRNSIPNLYLQLSFRIFFSMVPLSQHSCLENVIWPLYFSRSITTFL